MSQTQRNDEFKSCLFPFLKLKIIEELQSILKTILKEKQGYITFLTGAGISAESGLPT